MKRHIIYASKANMDEYYPQYRNSLIAYSPYTGEEYSANPSDYWHMLPSERLRDHKGRVMQLVVKSPQQYKRIPAHKTPAKRPKRKK